MVLLTVAETDDIVDVPFALASVGLRIGRHASTPAIKAALTIDPIAKSRPRCACGNVFERSLLSMAGHSSDRSLRSFDFLSNRSLVLKKFRCCP